MCMVCIDNISIKEFRNSSWYQSQFSETLIPSGHLLFRPSLIPAKSLWPYLNPIISLSLSLSLSHSGHQSLFSEPREKTLSGRSNRRQKTFTAGNFFDELFPRTFRRRFFLHRKERLEEISNLSQSTGTRNPSTRRPRALFPAGNCISRAGA